MQWWCGVAVYIFVENPIRLNLMLGIKRAVAWPVLLQRWNSICNFWPGHDFRVQNISFANTIEFFIKRTINELCNVKSERKAHKFLQRVNVHNATALLVNFMHAAICSDVRCTQPHINWRNSFFSYSHSSVAWNRSFISKKFNTRFISFIDMKSHHEKWLLHCN